MMRQKKSRDSRRRKEDEVAVRSVFLEQENLRLRFELDRLHSEIERHRIVAFNANHHSAIATENTVIMKHQQVGTSAMVLGPVTSLALAVAAAAAVSSSNSFSKDEINYKSRIRPIMNFENG